MLSPAAAAAGGGSARSVADPAPSPAPSATSAASRRSWLSASWAAPDPEELRRRAERQERIRAAAAAQSVERAALVARRDVLAYFDALHRLGPLIYLDTLPAVLNAALTVTVGAVALFLDGGGALADYAAAGGGGACGLLLHTFVALLIAAAYALLGLMTYVTAGYRVTLDISLPFQALVVVLSGTGAVWVLFGFPVLVQWAQAALGGGALPCQAKQPLLFGFVLMQLVVVPVLVAVLLTKWGLATIVAGARQGCRSCLAVLCRKRVVVSEAAAAAAAAAAEREAGGSATPRGSPRADEAGSPSPRGAR